MVYTYHTHDGIEAERPRYSPLKVALVRLSEVMDLMIKAQRALLRSDKREARRIIKDAETILHGVVDLPLR